MNAKEKKGSNQIPTSEYYRWVSHWIRTARNTETLQQLKRHIEQSRQSDLIIKLLKNNIKQRKEQLAKAS